jgi:hypothetical protein
MHLQGNPLGTTMNAKLPFALKVVACLFVFGGVSAVIEVIVSLMNNTININFGVLGIFIGIGLFRLSQGWRNCALVFTWIALLALPIIGFLVLGHSGPLDFTVFGERVGYASKEFGFAMVAALFIYTVWQYRVLTRPDVCHLFLNQMDKQGVAPSA